MTETEKLIRDIQTLRESIQIDLADLASNPLREEKRKNIRVHIELCQIELKKIFLSSCGHWMTTIQIRTLVRQEAGAIQPVQVRPR